MSHRPPSPTALIPATEGGDITYPLQGKIGLFTLAPGRVIGLVDDGVVSVTEQISIDIRELFNTSITHAILENIGF